MARHKSIAHVAGVDDSPFSREHRRDVMIVGAVFALNEMSGGPVLVVSRHEPDRDAVRDALLLTRVPGGHRKWKIVERLGPMAPLEGVWVRRGGIDATQAASAIRRFSIHKQCA